MILIFLSRAYVTSANCRRELTAATELKKPLIVVVSYAGCTEPHPAMAFQPQSSRNGPALTPSEPIALAVRA